MPNELGKPHLEYLRDALGKTDEERYASCRQLFKRHLPESSMNEIGDATNKSWAPGNGRLKLRKQKQLKRRVEPNAKGGDGKAER